MAASCAEAEDSDATVAPGEEEQELSQVLESPTGSPSILHPQKHVCVPVPGRRDIVPCSSDEGTDEMLSQEYPPPAAVRQSTNDSQRATGPSHQALSQVEEKQASLMSEVSTILSSYGEILPLNFVRKVKESTTVLEGKLKEISEAHQSERKCLASAHTQLSQGVSSQEEGGGGGGGGGGEGQSLCSQLLSLSSRQKRLLECFKKQKEISLKVGELVEREIKAKKTVEASVKDASSSATSIYLPNLVKHLISCSQSNPTGSSISNSSSRHSGSAHTTLTSDTPNTPTTATKTLAQTQLRLSVNPPTQTRLRSANPTPTTGTHMLSAVQSTLSHLSHPPRDNSSSQAVRSVSLSSDGGDGGGTSARAALGSELTQPVPLSALVQHQLLPPGSILTCTVLGCQFRASLLEDGGLREVHTQGSPGFGGQEPPHKQPQQWLRSCWSRLGHCHKKITKKQAYNTVLCCGKPLSHYCEQYSRQQVSRYLSHKKSSGIALDMNITSKQQSAPSAPMNSGTGGGVNAADIQSHVWDTQAAFNLDTLLTSAQVLLVSSDYHSWELPANFWQEGQPLPPHVLHQLAMDLNS